jgi:steroid delta-isomerase-like uncharacterized protein
MNGLSTAGTPRADATSPEENKAVIRRWVETWTTGNVAAIDQLVTADFVRHDPNRPEIHGPEAEKQLVTMGHAAFPDLHFTVEDLIAEGDKVVARVTAQSTQQGELSGIAPTGKHVTYPVMEIYRLANGKIAEQWVIADALGLRQQLGVIPAPGQTPS